MLRYTVEMSRHMLSLAPDAEHTEECLHQQDGRTDSTHHSAIAVSQSSVPHTLHVPTHHDAQRDCQYVSSGGADSHVDPFHGPDPAPSGEALKPRAAAAESTDEAGDLHTVRQEREERI